MEKVISVTIAPAKQIATIRQGKKVLKRYNLKTKLPFITESKEFETYDYSNWCVSDRGVTRTVKIKVFRVIKIKNFRVLLKQPPIYNLKQGEVNVCDILKSYRRVRPCFI